MKYWIGILAFFIGEERLKNVVEDRLSVHEERPLFGGRVILTKHHNEGAVMDSMTEQKKIVHRCSYGVFGAVSLMLFQTFLCQKSCLRRLGISALFAGALSNTCDRFFRGYVVDYAILPYRKLKSIIFNLSDVMIMLGGILCLLTAIGDKD